MEVFSALSCAYVLFDGQLLCLVWLYFCLAAQGLYRGRQSAGVLRRAVKFSSLKERDSGVMRWYGK